jgi:hypothetical protein
MTLTAPRTGFIGSAHRILRACLAALILVSLGCSHPWYTVESRYVAGTRVDRPPEVTATPAYRRLNVGGNLKVALRAPDSCANQSAADATGNADSAGALIRTTCGVEMAELERGLVKAGYTVSSWNDVNSIVTVERVTPRTAAARLGAEVLFQVNSLERSESDPARDLRWERRFYTSNKDGENKGEAYVPEARAVTLERAMQQFESGLLPDKLMSATINATAVDVQTGETIWFYEWTQVEELAPEQKVEHLFLCNRKQMNLCFPREPHDEQQASDRSGGIRAVSEGPRDQDQRNAVYHRLVRTAVEDLVSRFTDGRN